MKASEQHALLSCEHGGNRVPPEWHYLFDSAGGILQSHCGWDKGALELARYIAEVLGIRLIAADTTRLLIDLNRSLHHRELFSGFTRHCDSDTKHRIIDEIYLPYRNRVEAAVAAAADGCRPFTHISVHSFTPVLAGLKRETDIGLLYDPKRKAEKHFCSKLQNRITESTVSWRVRRNYPYRGIADGLVSHLRKKYTETEYCGIELEINQAIISDTGNWRSLKQTLASAIGTVLDGDGI